MHPSPEAPARGPAIIAGVIQRLSASQLKKHKQCPRAWYFSKVLRLPEPTTGAQNIGTEGHAQLEHYLSTGQDVLGPFARSGFDLLPVPGRDLLVEQKLDGASPLTAGGIPFTGSIDVVNPRRLATDGVLRITDHKFTACIEELAATAEQLADANTEPGLQMVGYGAWALGQVERFPGLRVLELEHIYYQTRGQRLAASVVASVPVEHIAHEWRTKVEHQVETMKQHAQAARADDVPANYGPACVKYGGCPFLAKCLTGGNKTMSLRDRLLPTPLDLPAVLPPDAPEPAPVQVAPEVAEQPAPKRRGRPPKSDLRVLYVDCLPTKHDGTRPESLTGYVDTMHRKVAEASGLDDVRFAGGDSALGFGRWRGALAMAARAELPPPGSYVALGIGQSELMQVIVEALEPTFDVVVRGVR
ncbi:PD-(D/E)XK nuclease family protein [Myxococcus landrumensis]|uniref:PD-(D/E)XK nuclease family protein n=1 Tax=Myxococcus landrumensis TaxID=2813577 RepID=A0ABX7NEU9_9BACT|nr:PD-(D/E)XK nuclease family protein [Myxococcus landrumus]QSQ17193.1 PD-(D/E)XK nuclease family protein [Myxococcus landrumus]